MVILIQDERNEHNQNIFQNIMRGENFFSELFSLQKS